MNCCDDADYEVFLALDGSPQEERWRPVKVWRFRADDRKLWTTFEEPPWDYQQIELEVMGTKTCFDLITGPCDHAGGTAFIECR